MYINLFRNTRFWILLNSSTYHFYNMYVDVMKNNRTDTHVVNADYFSTGY